MWYNQHFKNVNIFLSTNPTTLILSSLVSEFLQSIQIWKKKFGGGGRGLVQKGASSLGKYIFPIYINI